MDINAAILREKNNPFVIDRLKIREPAEHEVLVRIAGCGICHTDIASQEQSLPVPLPVVLGHEGSGIVERVGKAVKKVAPGDHVVLTIDSCGTCSMCLEAKSYCCYYGAQLNFGMGVQETASQNSTPRLQPYANKEFSGAFCGQSSFATYVLARERSVVKVRPDAPIELLGPFGCSGLTGAGAVINAFKASPGTSIVIIGTGPVGLNAVIGAKIAGCVQIIAVDINEERLRMAKEFGATAIINPKNENVIKTVRQILPNGVNYVLDTTALNESCQAAMQILAKGGTLGILGAAPYDRNFSVNMMSIIFEGVYIHGICLGDSIPDKMIPILVDLYMQGVYPFDKMLTRYPFADINQAIEDQRTGKIIKAILTF